MADLTLEEILRVSLQAVKEYVDENVGSQTSIVYMTQEDYDALSSIDPYTLYIITN